MANSGKFMDRTSKKALSKNNTRGGNSVNIEKQSGPTFTEKFPKGEESKRREKNRIQH